MRFILYPFDRIRSQFKELDSEYFDSLHIALMSFLEKEVIIDPIKKTVRTKVSKQIFELFLGIPLILLNDHEIGFNLKDHTIIIGSLAL